MLPPPHLVTDIYAGSDGVYSAVCTLPSPSQEHNSTSLPVLQDKQLSDHGQQFIHATNTMSSSTGGHVSTSQSSPLRILSPPDNLHLKLSYLIKYINKLSSLIDRLQELASCTPTEDQSQLLNQVAALRAMFKKRQVHCIEFCNWAKKTPIDICSTYLMTFNGNATSWIRWRGDWKLRGCYVERPLNCICYTSLE